MNYNVCEILLFIQSYNFSKPKFNTINYTMILLSLLLYYDNYYIVTHNKNKFNSCIVSLKNIFHTSQNYFNM